MRGTQLEYELMLSSKIDLLHVLALSEIPEMQAVAVFAAKQYVRNETVLERGGARRRRSTSRPCRRSGSSSLNSGPRQRRRWRRVSCAPGRMRPHRRTSRVAPSLPSEVMDKRLGQVSKWS